MRRAVVVTAITICAASGCSGGSSGNPGGPAPTASSITINLQDLVLAGVSVVATATATMSNGQTQAVASGWRSDAPSVATITDGGSLTALANGEATITVALGAVQGSKRIRVAPNYDGRWQGSQVVTACTATGAFVGICEDEGGVIGVAFPIALTARHPGQLTVSGEFTVEMLTFPTFTTQIESNGRIRFSSTTTVEGINADVSWDINSSQGGHAAGTIRERYSAPTIVPGDVVYDSTLADFSKTGTADADRQSVRGRIASVRARLSTGGRR